MPVEVKICGLNTPASVEASVAAGADMVGFNFFAKSPRFVSINEAASLASSVPDSVLSVGVLVNPDNELLSRILSDVPLDLVQLHGDEPPDRVAEIRARFGKPVMKVVKVAEADDLAQVKPYTEIIERLMFDTKPPKDATLPGGNAKAFDWTILKGFRFDKPWLLAGGLTVDNVATAIRLTGAPGVDTASGVEDRPGVKNSQKIRQFIAAAGKR
ncbi:MAG: phosphoribosylanthranilate isomerase [Alphaproteobacteria bacterium]